MNTNASSAPRDPGATPDSPAPAKSAGNPAADWHAPNQQVDDPAGRFAFQRLHQRLFDAHHRPKFQLARDHSFFMIGSCFARGLEQALSMAKFKVASLSRELDEFERAGNGGSPLGATNRYNTGSIVNELRWGLDPDHPFPAGGIVDLGEDRALDLHMNPTLAPGNRETTCRRRAIYQRMVASIREVDVVVLTLGLVEVWIDQQLGIALNSVPHPRVARQFPGRFRFARFGFSENLANLQEAHRILQRFGKPGQKIIVTTSPVPLGKTFTDLDVVVANTYSKSVLRSVAAEFADAHDNVDYFPSYEIVMNSDRAAAWMEDKRHVRGELAHFIMRKFVRHYIGDGAPQVEMATNPAGYE